VVGRGSRLVDRLRGRWRRGRRAPAVFGGQGTRDRAGRPLAGPVVSGYSRGSSAAEPQVPHPGPARRRRL